MKKLFFAVICVVLSWSAFAELRWETDWKKASELAKKNGTPVMILFTGSDWCGYCVKMKNEVFSKAEFDDYAAKHLVLLYVDFPRQKTMSIAQKRHNAELGRKYKVRGFPTIIVVDANGNVLGDMVGYAPLERLMSMLRQVAGK